MQNAQERQHERAKAQVQKKIEAANSKLEGIHTQLDTVYAQGKISEQEYSELARRKDEIGILQVIIGKVPFIALGKRYITGKIDKAEYKSISSTILPGDYFTELEDIETDLIAAENRFTDFIQASLNLDASGCQKCSKKKSLFSSLKEYLGIRLCSECAKEFTTVRSYRGYNGKYFIAEPKYMNESEWRLPEISINMDIL